MAGHVISLYLKERGHNVIGLARKKYGLVETIVCDVRNLSEVESIILEGKYDFVINCVGILNEYAERDISNAIFINSYFPHFLAKITQNIKTKIIQISTDCVFSGRKGSYKDTDVPDGESIYDRTKALGELIDEKNITFRNSIIGPDINVNGIGLLNWFMKQKNDVQGYSGAIWTGVTTLQLAKTIEEVSTKNIFGLFNLVRENSISKYELLLLFNKYIKRNKQQVNKVLGIVCDKSLVSSKTDFCKSIPDYEQMIYELSEWMIEHKDLYPHYDLTKGE